MKAKSWSVLGTVGMYGGPERSVVVEEAGTGRPVLTLASQWMIEYIDGLESSDAEEKYMPLRFVYTGACDLIAVIVPSRDPRTPAKIAVDNWGHRKVDIYGDAGWITTRSPLPMPMDEFHKACDAAELVHSIALRPHAQTKPREEEKK